MGQHVFMDSFREWDTLSISALFRPHPLHWSISYVYDLLSPILCLGLSRPRVLLTKGNIILISQPPEYGCLGWHILGIAY